MKIRYDEDHFVCVSVTMAKGSSPGSWRRADSRMRERAQRIGSQLDFWSEVGAGTEVELKVPASMAYQNRQDRRRFRLFHREGRDEQRS